MTLAILAMLAGPGMANAGSPAVPDDIAELPSPDYCAHPMVTVGIPHEYANTRNGEFRYENRGAHKNHVCAVVAFGTPYQLVSWLENGSVQAAVLSDFAVSVMRADAPQRFDEEYERFPVKTLLSLPQKERRLLLTDGAGNPEPDTDRRLGDFLSALKSHPPGQSIQKNGVTQREETLLLPSHLSPAVPFLVRYAKYWADDVAWKSDDERERFYQRLLRSIRFGDPVKPGARTNGTTATLQLFDEALDASAGKRPTPPNEVKGHGVNLSLDDRLVVRKSVLLADRDLRMIVELRNKARDASPADQQSGADEALPLFADKAIDELALGPTLTAFRDTNYRSVQFSNVTQRHFRFTIDELWTLLRHTDAEAPAKDAGNLALVLTGGGVKAAYQTRMLDELYDEQRLVSADDTTPRPAGSQKVQYVIGTSGGALLGVFVAAMDQKFNQVRAQSGDKRLTAILWKEPGSGIRSYDVFPFVDMMRYASLIMALVVVWIVSATMLAVFRSNYPQVKRFDHSNESFFGRRARAWRESWPWILVMLIAPIAILTVASVNRIEHVPIETGVYYAVMAMMVFYSDVRLFPSKHFAWKQAHLTRPAGLALIAAVVLITTAFARPALLLRLSGFEDPAMIFVNLCGLGFVALVLALHLFFHSQSEYFEPQPRGQILRAFAVLLGIVVISYTLVSLAMWADRTSLLEMNGGFWRYFLMAAAALTVLYMWLGRAPGEHQAKSFWQDTLGYLFSEYPSRAVLGSERRFMRFMTLNVLAWLWWNMLAAPALYGNGNARSYLTGAFCRFTELARNESQEKCRRDASVGELAKAPEFPLAVPFVITATSLDKRQERYFLFVSGTDDDEIDKQLSADAWSNVVKDPRWVVVRKPVDKELQDVAFASGSPFPVFSAHDVQVRALKNPERLIDGGFAHNRPLEAALALGARKVLVINSSPLEPTSSGAQCTMFTLKIGELACNLPKLIPYLWERSQVEDVLSTRDMVVASIYPTAPRGWPALTDFRAKIVKDLIKDAEQDEDERVGVIESWGEPQFTEPAGLLGYDLGQVEHELKRID